MPSSSVRMGWALLASACGMMAVAALASCGGGEDPFQRTARGASVAVKYKPLA